GFETHSVIPPSIAVLTFDRSLLKTLTFTFLAGCAQARAERLLGGRNSSSMRGYSGFLRLRLRCFTVWTLLRIGIAQWHRVAVVLCVFACRPSRSSTKTEYLAATPPGLNNHPR